MAARNDPAETIIQISKEPPWRGLFLWQGAPLQELDARQAFTGAG